jgi:hypothetical protein
VRDGFDDGFRESDRGQTDSTQLLLDRGTMRLLLDDAFELDRRHARLRIEKRLAETCLGENEPSGGPIGDESNPMVPHVEIEPGKRHVHDRSLPEEFLVGRHDEDVR